MDALTTPLNWQKVRLGDICEFGNGGAYETLIVENGDFKLISLNSIDIDGNLKNTMKRVNFYDNSLKQDDIVMVLSDVAHGDFLGLCAVIPSNDYVLNQRMGRLRKRNDCINILFLRLYINANQKYFKMQGQGSSQLNLSKKAIEDFEIPLPPLNEQIAIANVLSTLDRYLCSLDALILKKESVKKALSFELLSQRKRLKGFNQAWQKVRLGDIAEIKRGVRITKNELDVFGKYPVVSGGVGFLGYTNNFNRYENTITIAQYGTAGYVNFQKNKFWANDICFCVYHNKDVIKNIFLYYFLKVNQNYLYEISNRNATPYSISKDKILDFEILLPPLNEQIAIANILSALDNEIISLKNKKRQFENIKKALNHDLMSAKIRVLKK
ncbi:restriction endonuclease subunit S [Helicobacter pylori]|uniref:restriction endonuclease subunit S n=1 Tax=Helicobacter pylori TaxID=210 RepID=UPI000EB0EF27|nr:restriction endonuclease subunit S [Helicobacter pylori]RKV37970.1 restriction endonuclease subunit S [Helicobacter pylori]WQX75383.1 restriction endonuclease subunit S [Helicobacter pylori]